MLNFIIELVGFCFPRLLGLFLARDQILVGRSSAVGHNHVKGFRQSILRMLLIYPRSKSLGYKLIVSQVFLDMKYYYKG